MAKGVITTSKIAPAVGPFSPAVMSGGLLYLSGQVAQDPASGKLISGDTAQQTEQILRNTGAVLQAAGKGFADVLKVGVFLTEMGDFQAMNAVYGKYFETPYPARTTVGVAALPLGARVEMDFIAGAAS
ncbi:MAG TPA: Rid family detoxifying hydrolase [Gemmatimonadales bacterium]|nr:Rid family detoxifying hydrolase [Gemmatimonadales bacterium]